MFALFQALVLFIVTVSAIILIFMDLLMVITRGRFVHAFTSLHSKTPVCFSSRCVVIFYECCRTYRGIWILSDPQSFYIFGLLAGSSSTDPLALSLALGAPAVGRFFSLSPHTSSTVPSPLVWHRQTHSHQPPLPFCRHVLHMSELLMVPQLSYKR